MSIGKLVVGLGAGIALAAASIAPASAQEGEFDGSAFTCLKYTSGQGDNSSGKVQADLARLWMTGYLTGYYKAKGNLDIVDSEDTAEKLARTFSSKCREYPDTSVMTVALQAIGKERNSIPAMAAPDFNPQSYTCGNHVDAKAGSAAEAMKADLAEMWAFAFIQGFKNLDQPDMVIPMENKPVLTGAVSKNCEKNRDTSYFDLTAMVAQAVKLQ